VMRVPFKVQVVFCDTTRLSTVTAPKEPEQLKSSAAAGARIVSDNKRPKTAAKNRIRPLREITILYPQCSYTHKPSLDRWDFPWKFHYGNS
jgi:hypothetical protein